MLALLSGVSGKAGRVRKGGEETIPRDINFTMIYLISYWQSGLRAVGLSFLLVGVCLTALRGFSNPVKQTGQTKRVVNEIKAKKM